MSLTIVSAWQSKITELCTVKFVLRCLILDCTFKGSLTCWCLSGSHAVSTEPEATQEQDKAVRVFKA